MLPSVCPLPVHTSKRLLSMAEYVQQKLYTGTKSTSLLTITKQAKFMRLTKNTFYYYYMYIQYEVLGQ